MQAELKEYLELLVKRYQAHYNVQTNSVIAGKNVDIFAISVIEHFRNILTRKIQFDRYQEREIILVKGFNRLLGVEDIRNFSAFLIAATKELITPSFDIMSHTINGIIISSHGFSGEAIALAQRFRYGRTFFLGIKGWCDIRLLEIDIKNFCVHCNAKGKEIASIYSF